MLFILNFNFINIAFCDYAMRGQFGFQDASTSIMQGIINLHHHIFFFIIIVLIFVSYMMIKTYKVSV
jgi:cytochrome c oxidase subunit 2